MMATQSAATAAARLSARWRLTGTGTVISLALHACPTVAGSRLQLPLGVWGYRATCCHSVEQQAAAAPI